MDVCKGLPSRASLSEQKAEQRHAHCDCVGQQTALADELFVLAGDEGLQSD